jgi:two-component system phosphate regulon sensor histidine kinase PhoR
MQMDAIQTFPNALPMPAMAIDAGKSIVAMNSDSLVLFGEQTLNRNYITMIRQPSIIDVIEATLQDGKNREGTYLNTVSGTETEFDVSCRGVKVADEATVSNVILCFQDVTDINHAGQMRRDFVANVSHELRTPLTAMIGFIETLIGPAREDAAAHMRFLPIMLSEAQRMNRLVGELLSLGRVEVDERVKPTAQACLNDILSATVDAIRPLADKGDVTLELDLPSNPVLLAGDSDQLRQVFTNLIENAVKYGGEGKRVLLRMTLSERDEALRGPGCRVEVIDYGAGMDPIHLPRLTERFYRVDDHRSRELGGTGLGLAIVKHIINRHRGQMRIQSTPTQGTTFAVVLPVALDQLQ